MKTFFVILVSFFVQPSLAQDERMPNLHCSKVQMFPYMQRWPSDDLKKIWDKNFLRKAEYANDNFIISGTHSQRITKPKIGQSPIPLVSQAGEILVYRKTWVSDYDTYFEKGRLGIYLRIEKNLTTRTIFSYVCREIDDHGVPENSLEGVDSLISKALREIDDHEKKHRLTIPDGFDEQIQVREPSSSMFGLEPLSIIEMARILDNPDLKIHVVHLTASALAASFIIQSYRFLGLGGRQKVLAAIVPPGLLNDWLGRPGYRVPPHEVYSLGDVRDLAQTLKSFTSDIEAQEYLNQQDPELAAYFQVVVDYVRKAQDDISREAWINGNAWT